MNGARALLTEYPPHDETIVGNHLVAHIQGSLQSFQDGRGRFLYQHSIRSPSEWGNLRPGERTCFLSHETRPNCRVLILREGLMSMNWLAREPDRPPDLLTMFARNEVANRTTWHKDPQVVYTYPTIYTDGEPHPHSRKITEDSIVIPVRFDDVTVFNSKLRDVQTGSPHIDMDIYLQSGLDLRTYIERISTPDSSLNEFGEIIDGSQESRYSAEVVVAAHWIDPVNFYPHGLLPDSMKAERYGSDQRQRI